MGSWRIWLRFYDWNGRIVGHDVYPVSYATKIAATLRAKKLWGNDPACVTWFVSKEDPFTDGTKEGSKR